MLNKEQFSRIFKVKDVVRSGAGDRKGAAHIKILAIEEDKVRYQSLRSKSKNALKYSYLQTLLDGYEELDAKQIQKSVNKVLQRAGLKQNYSTENYAYSFAKAYHDRNHTNFFLSQGESLNNESPLGTGAIFIEGERIIVYVERIERDEKARRKCIEHFGAVCRICEFDFEKGYGPLGSGFIHVHHHRLQLAVTQGKHSVDPIADLIPLCPNCHAMVHRKKDMYSVKDLKGIWSAAQVRSRKS